jgi:hypothetical protein
MIPDEAEAYHREQIQIRKETEAAREVLDDGNPKDLGRQYRALVDRLPHLNVLGGCCGTDQRHLEAICRRCSTNRWGSTTACYSYQPGSERIADQAIDSVGLIVSTKITPVLN